MVVSFYLDIKKKNNTKSNEKETSYTLQRNYGWWKRKKTMYIFSKCKVKNPSDKEPWFCSPKQGRA